MNLGDIFCQDAAIEQLQRTFDAGRMGHAYLFAGDEGTGRETTARAFAKMLLCGNRRKIKKNGRNFYDSCGTCASCTVFEGGGHSDYRPVHKELLAYTRDGKNRKPPVEFPIDVIREFLIEKAAQRPRMSQYVVYVVSEAEKLNRESQNALLKVLEEPPPFCVILLICSRPDELLATTRSRCQTVRFGPVDERFIREKLVKDGATPQEADFWAGFAQGSVAKAIDWGLLSSEKTDGYKIKKELLERLAAIETADVPQIADWMCKTASAASAAWSAAAANVSPADLHKKAQKDLLQMIICALNDAIRANVGQERKMINADQRQQIEQLARRYDAVQAAILIEDAYEKIRWVDANVSEKLIFEGLLFNLAGADIMNG